MPAPRVVGNRRIRAGGIALATMLLAFGAALSGIALVSVSRTSAYLAIAHPVPIGTQITASDLTTVQLSGGGGLSLLPAGAASSVVGRYAKVSLEPGSLLSPAQITDKSVFGQGDVEIAIRTSYLPSATMAPGDQISLVPLSVTASNPRTAAAASGPYAATVVDVGKPGSDGAFLLHVAVAANDALAIVSQNANGGLGVILKPGS